MRTLMHYAVMLRDLVPDAKKDPERAEQLLQQALGESNQYVSVGLTSPARDAELRNRPRIKSPKRDIEIFEFKIKTMRSTVEFHDLKKLRRQIAAMEKNDQGADGDVEVWDKEEVRKSQCHARFILHPDTFTFSRPWG